MNTITTNTLCGLPYKKAAQIIIAGPLMCVLLMQYLFTVSRALDHPSWCIQCCLPTSTHKHTHTLRERWEEEDHEQITNNIHLLPHTNKGTHTLSLTYTYTHTHKCSITSIMHSSLLVKIPINCPSPFPTHAPPPLLYRETRKPGNPRLHLETDTEALCQLV